MSKNNQSPHSEPQNNPAAAAVPPSNPSTAETEKAEKNIHEIPSGDIIRRYSDLFQDGSPLHFLKMKSEFPRTTAHPNDSNHSYIDEELKDAKFLATEAVKHARTLSWITLGLLFLLIGYDTLKPQVYNSAVQWLPHALPRIIFIVVIQVFAYFYFSITKTSLNRVQSLINEKTNIEFKLYALRTAIVLNQTKTAQEILADFAKTERNFIIDKDKTTVELEKIKHELDYLKSTTSILDHLGSFIDKFKPKQ
jgi:hypothetical protein